MKNYACNNEDIANYVFEELKLGDAQLEEVLAHCEKSGLPSIAVCPSDGRHLEVIAAASHARRAVEIGTLGGYSGICLLRGMGRTGKLHSFEMDPHHAQVAIENFERCGYKEQAEVHIGPALENLDSIKSQGPFDLVFIDADKLNYPNYLKWAIDNLKVGGMIIGDNTFAFGNIQKNSVADEALQAQVTALRQFNRELSQSNRFATTILPTGEGMTIAVKTR